METLRFFMLIGALSSLVAWGNSTGIAGSPQPNCNGCHQGGTAPTVTLTGPTSVVAGAPNQSYTLTLSGGAGVVGGFNVEATGAQVTWVPAAGQRVDQGQLTHSAKANFQNGMLQIVFALNAPASAGSFVLAAKGLSGNNAGGDNGDSASDATLTVTVTAPSGGSDAGVDAGVPTPPPPPVSDAGLPVVPLGDGGVDPYLLPPKVDTTNYDALVEAGCSSSAGGSMLFLVFLVAFGLRRRRYAESSRMGQKPTASQEART